MGKNLNESTIYYKYNIIMLYISSNEIQNIFKIVFCLEKAIASIWYKIKVSTIIIYF